MSVPTGSAKKQVLAAPGKFPSAYDDGAKQQSQIRLTPHHGHNRRCSLRNPDQRKGYGLKTPKDPIYSSFQWKNYHRTQRT